MAATRDLWIVEEHIEHDWLCPWRETTCVWPHMSERGEVFVRDTIDATVNRVVAHIVTRCEPLLRRASPSQQHLIAIPTPNEQIVIPVGVTRSRAALPDLLGPNCHFRDVDSELSAVEERHSASKDDDLVFFLSIPVRTIRLDESQHLLLALRGMRVVWSAWTLEEQTLCVRRLLSEARTVKIEIKLHVFAFKRRSSSVGTVMHEQYRRLIVRLFSGLLPEDVASLVAQHVVEVPSRLTPTQFQRGAARGVLNYATARLVRTACRCEFSRISLRGFHDGPEERRAANYKAMCRAFRARHRIFGRTVAHKALRSGRMY